MDAERIFPDEYVPNVQGSSYHPKWEKANPVDAAKWHAFRDAVLAYQAGGSIVVPDLATKYGKALVAAGKLHMSVIDIGAEWNPPDIPPDPPPTGNPYLTDRFSQGIYVGVTNPPSPWTRIFSYGGTSSPGVTNLTNSSTTISSPDRRVALVRDPAGSGQWVSRHEVRDSDPGWPAETRSDKAQIRSDVSQTLNGSYAAALGRTFWLGISYYLPYGVAGGVLGVDGFSYALGQYDWPVGGTNPFLSHWNFHSEANSVGAIQTSYYKGADPAYIEGAYAAVTSFAGSAPLSRLPLIQITNSNGSRYAANHNRWIRELRGFKVSGNSDGWQEFWVDNVLIHSRTGIATVATNETGLYFDFEMYSQSDATHASGGSVVYFKDIRIGYTKADVV